MRYSRNVSTVSCGSQSPVALKAFSPASTSFHAIDLPCLAAAASITSCAAGQMSTPVPSPSTKGMIGSSGTVSTPLDIVILSAMAKKLLVGVPHAGLHRRVERDPEGAHERGGLVGAATVEEPAHQGAADDHTVA